MSMKKLFALLLAVVMVLGLVACAPSGDSNQPGNVDATGDAADATGGAQAGDEVTEPQYGGHLNVHVASGISTLEPVTHGAVWNYMYCAAVWENPLTRDAENNIAPGVCDYEVNEDMTVVKLWPREGLKFHNGDLVDAEDVMASVQRALNIGNGVPAYMGPVVKSMSVTDNVLTIEFTEYSELAWSRLAAYQTWMAVMPKEICEQYPNSDIKTLEHYIGTGPYKMKDFVANDFVTIERFDDYVPVEDTGRTGYAGVKHAYLDSITYYTNTDYSSSTMAVMTGQYDISDVIESEYEEMALQAGVVRQKYNDSNTGIAFWFNNAGGPNICAKYPALRKAIMAAIDMPEWAAVVSDEALEFGGPPVMDEKYDTGILDETDWYGETDLVAVEKYLDEARAAGYNDEPVQIVLAAESEAWTLIMGYLDNAGINYQTNFMDSMAYSEYIIDPMNNWDMGYKYLTGAWTPSTIIDDIISYYWTNEDRDRLRAELTEMVVDSDEYMAKWKELHQLMVDECTHIWFGFLDWYWNHNQDLVPNYEGVHAYFFNSYWKHPEEHQGF